MSKKCVFATPPRITDCTPNPYISLELPSAKSHWKGRHLTGHNKIVTDYRSTELKNQPLQNR